MENPMSIEKAMGKVIELEEKLKKGEKVCFLEVYLAQLLLQEAIDSKKKTK